jgi:hypothetical protein
MIDQTPPSIQIERQSRPEPFPAIYSSLDDLARRVAILSAQNVLLRQMVELTIMELPLIGETILASRKKDLAMELKARLEHAYECVGEYR